MNRLLAIFLPEADVLRLQHDYEALMARYIYVLTLRQTESIEIPINIFNDISVKAKDEQNTILDKYRDKIDNQLEIFSEKIETEMSINDIVPLGIFDETEASFSYAFISKYLVTETEDEVIEHEVVGGMNTLLLHNKTAYVFVYATFNSQEDIEWVKSTSKEMIQKLILANPSDDQIQSNNFLESSDWDEVINKAVGGAVVGLVIGVLVYISRVFRSNKKEEEKLPFLERLDELHPARHINLDDSEGLVLMQNENDSLASIVQAWSDATDQAVYQALTKDLDEYPPDVQEIIIKEAQQRV